jgi:hypothetical protein
MPAVEGLVTSPLPLLLLFQLLDFRRMENPTALESTVLTSRLYHFAVHITGHQPADTFCVCSSKASGTHCRCRGCYKDQQKEQSQQLFHLSLLWIEFVVLILPCGARGCFSCVCRKRELALGTVSDSQRNLKSAGIQPRLCMIEGRWEMKTQERNEHFMTITSEPEPPNGLDVMKQRIGTEEDGLPAMS